MYYNVYTMYDKLTDTIGNLWLAVNDAEASERARVDMLERKTRDPKFNIERFAVMYLGSVQTRVMKNKEGKWKGYDIQRNILKEEEAYIINQIGDFEIPKGAIDLNSEVEGAREKNTMKEILENAKRETK